MGDVANECLARGGESIEATERFVRRHGRFVRDIVERYVPQTEVDDVVQQIFIVVWRRSAEPIALVDAPLEHQRAWLYQTARFHVWTYRRGAHRRRRLTRRLLDQSRTVEGNQLDPRTLDALYRSIQRLSTKEWTILEARYYDGMSTAEIAMWLGITPEAARQRLSRSMSSLRIVFEREVHR